MIKDDLRDLLTIPDDRLVDINRMFLDPDTQIVNDFIEIVSKYGTPEEINKNAEEASRLPELLKKVEQTNPEYLKDLEWLTRERDAGSFIKIPEYRRKVLGEQANVTKFSDDFAVTLEISALQYFPWLIKKRMGIYPQLQLQCRLSALRLLKLWTQKERMGQIFISEDLKRLPVILVASVNRMTML